MPARQQATRLDHVVELGKHLRAISLAPMTTTCVYQIDIGVRLKTFLTKARFWVRPDAADRAATVCPTAEADRIYGRYEDLG